MSKQVLSSKNGKVVAWVDNGIVYIVSRYWKRLKAYYAEYGYKNYRIV